MKRSLAVIFIFFILSSRALAFDMKDVPKNEYEKVMPLNIDICLNDNLKTAEITVSKDFQLDIYSGGDKIDRSVSGSGLTLEVTGVEDPVPAKIDHYAVLMTFPYSYIFRRDKKNEVVSKLEEIEKASRKLYFFTYGCILTQPGNSLKIDTRTLFAAAGPFKTEEETRLYCNQMREKHKISAFPHPVRASAPACKISMKISYLDRTGKNKIEEKTSTAGAVKISQKYEVDIAKMEFGRGDSWHNYKNARYHGNIAISADNGGMFQIINSVSFEEMLKISVPSEIEPNSPYQSICAQAIAARSEILTKYMTRHTESDYDFCAGTHCQAYGGLSNKTSDAARAVEETTGKVIISDGHIVDTVYHADCGGVTEDSNKIWSAPFDPSLVKISDTPDKKEYDFSTDEAKLREFIKSPPKTYCSVPGACNNPDKFRWTRSFTQKEMDKMIEKQFNIGGLRELKILERGKSGRIICIELVGNSKTERVYKELPIRKLFGMLRSALFVADIKTEFGEKKYVFTGAGWGHGVGLCQDGAKGMGLSGKSYEEILLHYFSNSKIVKME